MSRNQSRTAASQGVAAPEQERVAAVRASYMLLPKVRGRKGPVTLSSQELALVKDLMVYVIRDDQFRTLGGQTLGEEGAHRAK